MEVQGSRACERGSRREVGPVRGPDPGQRKRKLAAVRVPGCTGGRHSAMTTATAIDPARSESVAVAGNVLMRMSCGIGEGVALSVA